MCVWTPSISNISTTNKIDVQFFEDHEPMSDDEDDPDPEYSKAIEESLRSATALVVEESRRYALVVAKSREVEDEALAHAMAVSAHEEEIHRLAKLQKVQERDAELASDLCVIHVMDCDEAEQTRHAQAVACVEEAVASRHEESKHGEWDCPKCTFRNKPYASVCSACEETAPVHRLAFSPMSPLRFGVELELIVTNGLRDGYSCDWIAKELRHLGVAVQYAGYSHETVNHWKIVEDASLRGRSNDLCCEIVSPILQGEQGLEDMRFLLENVRKLGIETNKSCGFHVHVDASCLAMSSLTGLTRLAQCFVALENAFDLLVALDAQNQAVHRRANQHQYCSSNLIAFGSFSNQQRWRKLESAQSISQLVYMMNPNSDRYRKINMTNLTRNNRPATCEFRQHGGVDELLEAEAWVRLLVRFCENASNRSIASSQCLLHQGATPKEELEALFQLVDCQGLEQFFVVERKLFVDHRLSNEWHCKVCYRRFIHCQALSQHVAATQHY
jgi:hypothetical protein